MSSQQYRPDLVTLESRDVPSSWTGFVSRPLYGAAPVATGVAAGVSTAAWALEVGIGVAVDWAFNDVPVAESPDVGFDSHGNIIPTTYVPEVAASAVGMPGPLSGPGASLDQYFQAW